MPVELEPGTVTLSLAALLAEGYRATPDDHEVISAPEAALTGDEFRRAVAQRARGPRARPPPGGGAGGGGRRGPAARGPTPPPPPPARGPARPALPEPGGCPVRGRRPP